MMAKLIIKAEVKNLGFSLIGVTTPDTPDHYSNFEAWLSGGNHGGMGYLSRLDTLAKRRDPRLLMPECKSILCLAFPYPNANMLQPGTDSPKGRIASYAWKQDYHIDLPARIETLMARIEKKLDHKIAYRVFTDSAPILERDLAARAGLGWIGKNGCLIHPEHGSFFLLAEVFVDIELESDQPFTADRCGSCRRCITACPTGCILPDRTIDSRRCISYLTIENKGPIPRDLRPGMGNWIFGCDVCQMVCPWNRLRVGNEDGNRPEDEINQSGFKDLIEEMALSEADFRQKYTNLPVLRAKRKGYLRNVAVALGNTHNKDAVPALIKALSNEKEPLIRCHCAWALGQIGGKAAYLALEQAFSSEKDMTVREEIQLILGENLLPFQKRIESLYYR